VLIVHGNHPMSEYSEPGYAYLAEHLASQGYLAVSIDENFLNGLAFFDGEFAEMPLRAWLILQHLQQWRLWNETPGNPFAGKVDLDRVALIGHSRGGEAVAWAAHLNWQSMEPVSSVSRPADFGFGIRGVVAIAPSYAYAGPGSRRPTLDHSNYLLLAGGHDADTYLLYGQQQYNHMRFDENPGGFKALAYVYQANHGQFNSVWGDADRGLYNSWLLNRAPLLTAEQQQQAARVLIAGFLHAAVRDEPAYRDLFRNPATARAWLPEGAVVTQYQDERAILVENNSGRADTQATTATRELTLSRAEALLLRDGQTGQGNWALHLAWDAGSRPVYEIALSRAEASAWGLTPAHSLTFALASVPGEASPGAVAVELETAAGESARLSLSDFAPLVAPLPAHLVKAGWLAGLSNFPGKMAPEERVLQTYTLPLASFTALNPDFDPAQLSAIRFAFDGGSQGAVYLDEIALVP
jgi:predicted dienelactone hydrolase